MGMGIVLGTQGNLWTATAVAINGESAVVEIQNALELSVFGTTSGASNLDVLISRDNVTFVKMQTIAANGDFHIHIQTAAKYIKLKSSAAVTITATVCGKA